MPCQGPYYLNQTELEKICDEIKQILLKHQIDLDTAGPDFGLKKFKNWKEKAKQDLFNFVKNVAHNQASQDF